MKLRKKPTIPSTIGCIAEGSLFRFKKSGSKYIKIKSPDLIASSIRCFAVNLDTGELSHQLPATKVYPCI